MTDSRDEERERQDREDEVRRDERERRSDELREAWRRNHPREGEEDGVDRPGRGRP